MTINTNTVVTLQIAMLDAKRNALEGTGGSVSYLHGSEDIFPLVQAALVGKAVGDKVEVLLSTADAFGDRDDTLVIAETLSRLPDGVAVDDVLECVEETSGQAELFRVVQIDGDTAFLDANHPLAGMDLVVQAEVMSIRDATAGEVAAATAFQLVESA